MEKKLQNIAALSQKYGSDPNYVFLGGGNTSVKNEKELYIKPSGVALATIQPEQFVCIDRKSLDRLFTLEMPVDVTAREAIAKFVLESSVRPLGAGRPSVETPLHNVIDYTYVVHLHPALVNGMTCAKNGKKVCKRLFPDALWIEYTDPGCTLSFFVKKQLDAIKAKTGKQPNVFFLQNHGVFVSADTPKEIDALYKDMMTKLKAEYKKAGISVTSDTIPAANDEDVFENAPVMRQLLANDDGIRPVVRCVGNALPYGGPLTPDHVVYAKSFAYVGDASQADMDAFKKKYGYLPKVACVKDKALFVTGDTPKDADAVAIALDNALLCQKLTSAFGGPNFLTEKQYKFIENWEVESYRRSVSLKGAAGGRLQNRICVVTGGAQGFGLGIAEYLAENGGIIVVADLNLEGAQATAEELCKKYGVKRAFAVGVNVADEDSVQAMVNTIAREVGGIDLFVSNAGVVRSGSVKELTLKDWTFVTNINYTGYFLCCKHAARLMAKQIVDGKGRWTDIVQINSKSGLEGSNKNGAYAGSKFGSIGLTQSFAKELVADCIKVNSVCPGNYLDGPLWSDPVKGLFVQYWKAGKVPGAKSVEDVRKYYMDKVPMRRGCFPSDVAKAIIYCVEQEYETGQAIPVTGGQNMLH